MLRNYIMASPIEYGLIAALMATGAVVAVTSYKTTIFQPASYTLVRQDIDGNVFVEDHDMTYEDCFAAARMPHEYCLKPSAR